MSSSSTVFLGNPSGGLGEIGGPETWWVAHQTALEHAGYMLRSRYRPGWRPSWVTTGKHYFNSEDGQIQSVGIEAFAPVARAHVLSAAPMHGRNSDL